MRLTTSLKNLRSRWAASRKQIVRSARTTDGRTVVLAGIGIVGAVALVGAIASNVATDKASDIRTKASAATSKPMTDESVAGSTSVARASNAVTITGCLERDDEKFRLKDTEGEDAPKSRSWKSGFLKKSAKSVNLIDAKNAARLPAHVGQRVRVTGSLNDRDMQVRSVQRIASSCSDKS